MKKKKIFLRILNSQKNVKFKELQIVVEAFGFSLTRISGSHHIYTNEEIEENINLQEINNEAKPYQVRQFLKIVEKYNLKFRDE